MMKRVGLFILILGFVLNAHAQYSTSLDHHSWTQTPPMGWNSWDCYGPTVVESEVKANADYMSQHLLKYGWEYIIVDIRWFVENDKAGGYNQTNPIYTIDEYGRYTPALNRFPSAANGVGFKALADYCHERGLKFGKNIHLQFAWLAHKDDRSQAWLFASANRGRIVYRWRQKNLCKVNRFII